MTDDDDKLAPEDAVPAAFTATLPKRAEVSTRDPRALESMRNKDVIVHANGVEYRGVLVGTDDAELYLRTELRHVSIALERIGRVVLAQEKPPALRPDVVDPSFFTADDDEKR